MLGFIDIQSAAKSAKISISGYIGVPEDWQFDDESEEVATKERMRQELERIASLSVDTIDVEIDSFGGSVNHGLAIYNALRATGAKIRTTYTGWSASIATIIGMAGDERIAPDNMFLLIHEARGMAMGTSNTIESYSEWLKQVNEKILDIYERGGEDRRTLKNIMAQDGGEGRWLNAKEAKRLGLITKIENSYQAAAYSAEQLIENKLPKIKNMSETNLKNKVLEVLGYRNDEALTELNASLTNEVESLRNQMSEQASQLAEAQAALTEAQAALTAANEAHEIAVGEMTAENAQLVEGLNATISEQTATIEANVQTIADLQEQLKGGGINFQNADPDLKDEMPESVKQDLARLRNKQGK